MDAENRIVPVFPPENAEHLLEPVRNSLQQGHEVSVTLVITGTFVQSEKVALPAEIIEAVSQVVTAMCDGLAVAVMPMHQILTTQEAANLLGMRRSVVKDLLDSGEIPHHQDDRHRRIMLVDLLDFDRKRRQERFANIDEMVAVGYQGNQHILCAGPEVV